MPSTQYLAAQLKACRDYMDQNLGHIPEVRKLVRQIDGALQREAAPDMHGCALSPVGIPMIRIEVHGNEATVSTDMLADARHAVQFVEKLREGIVVQLAEAQPR